jgi:hypothetical protein
MCIYNRIYIYTYDSILYVWTAHNIGMHQQVWYISSWFCLCLGLQMRGPMTSQKHKCSVQALHHLAAWAIPFVKYHTMWGPLAVSLFVNPMSTIVLSTISHNYWSYSPQLSYLWGPRLYPKVNQIFVPDLLMILMDWKPEKMALEHLMGWENHLINMAILGYPALRRFLGTPILRNIRQHEIYQIISAVISKQCCMNHKKTASTHQNRWWDSMFVEMSTNRPPTPVAQLKFGSSAHLSVDIPKIPGPYLVAHPSGL